MTLRVMKLLLHQKAIQNKLQLQKAFFDIQYKNGVKIQEYSVISNEDFIFEVNRVGGILEGLWKKMNVNLVVIEKGNYKNGVKSENGINFMDGANGLMASFMFLASFSSVSYTHLTLPTILLV